jgi:hypothetical protein
MEAVIFPFRRGIPVAVTTEGGGVISRSELKLRVVGGGRDVGCGALGDEAQAERIIRRLYIAIGETLPNSCAAPTHRAETGGRGQGGVPWSTRGRDKRDKGELRLFRSFSIA